MTSRNKHRKVWLVIRREHDWDYTDTRIDSVWSSRKAALARATEMIEIDKKRRIENRGDFTVEAFKLNTPEGDSTVIECYYNGEINVFD